MNISNNQISKVKVVGESCMVLISDGTIMSWGDNTEGQLAIPRSYLSKLNVKFDIPQNVNFLNSKVKDLSGNPLNFGK